LRYGFYDPAVFGDEPRSFDFPFLPKPENYRWVEDADSPFYNQLVFETDETQASRRGERLFDLIIPVGWNDALPDARGGSAIFMHSARPDFSGTSGCATNDPRTAGGNPVHSHRGCYVPWLEARSAPYCDRFSAW
jgi:L,D-peptidoglycan transpeptidase YkuD (ErfK/YbiS/YcfS/YnhG family)